MTPPERAACRVGGVVWARQRPGAGAGPPRVGVGVGRAVAPQPPLASRWLVRRRSGWVWVVRRHPSRRWRLVGWFAAGRVGVGCAVAPQPPLASRRLVRRRSGWVWVVRFLSGRCRRGRGRLAGRRGGCGGARFAGRGRGHGRGRRRGLGRCARGRRRGRVRRRRRRRGRRLRGFRLRSSCAVPARRGRRPVRARHPQRRRADDAPARDVRRADGERVASGQGGAPRDAMAAGPQLQGPAEDRPRTVADLDAHTHRLGDDELDHGLPSACRPGDLQPRRHVEVEREASLGVAVGRGAHAVAQPAQQLRDQLVIRERRGVPAERVARPRAGVVEADRPARQRVTRGEQLPRAPGPREACHVVEAVEALHEAVEDPHRGREGIHQVVRAERCGEPHPGRWRGLEGTQRVARHGQPARPLQRRAGARQRLDRGRLRHSADPRRPPAAIVDEVLPRGEPAAARREPDELVEPARERPAPARLRSALHTQAGERVQAAEAAQRVEDHAVAGEVLEDRRAAFAAAPFARRGQRSRPGPCLDVALQRQGHEPHAAGGEQTLVRHALRGPQCRLELRMPHAAQVRQRGPYPANRPRVGRRASACRRRDRARQSRRRRTQRARRRQPSGSRRDAA